MRLTRRDFCGAALHAAWGLAVSACNEPAANQGARLSARPAAPTGSADPGLSTLSVGAVRDGLLYVPPSYSPSTPVPLLLAFHGAGGTADGPVNFLRPYADTHGFVIVAIDSRASTWDAVRDAFGRDVPIIDRSLSSVFERCAIQPDEVYAQGFSDGASYALGLGLANGDLFSGIVAFSPGFIPGAEPHGQPRVFISHGTADTILPIQTTSRVIVPRLRDDGYDVTYREFSGGHAIPAEIANDAMTWLGVATP